VRSIGFLEAFAGSGALQGLVIDALGTRPPPASPGDSGRGMPLPRPVRYPAQQQLESGRQRPSSSAVACETTKAIKQQRSHLPSCPSSWGRSCGAACLEAGPKTAPTTFGTDSAVAERVPES